MGKTTRKAFTLIEILLAITLIAVCGGIAALGVNLFSEDSLKSRPPDRLFCSALRLAKSEAISRGVKISISYSKDGYFLLKKVDSFLEIKRLWLSKELEDYAKNGGINTDNLPKLTVLINLDTPNVIGNENVEFDLEPTREILISPDGICSPATVKFITPNEEPIIVKIDPMSASPKDF